LSEAYHLGELRIAQDPRHPSHILPPPVRAGTRVLDVGCGAGQTLAVAYPELETFGIDVDLEALTLGPRIAPKVRFTNGRAEQLPFGDAQFDLVIARVSLAYTNIPQSLREIRRVLKPGGKLWITLHAFSVPWASAKTSNWKGKVFFAYIVLNSLCLHFFGRATSFLGRFESFQTEGGIIRLLKRAGFEGILIERGRHFVVTAHSRSR
jgi:ubiquinone/menaquinone biosynthesis C-methylase UbiE